MKNYFMQEVIKELKSMIAAGDYIVAVEKLRALPQDKIGLKEDDVISLESRINDLERSKLRGVISEESYLIQKNQIVESLFSIINILDFKEEVPVPKVLIITFNSDRELFWRKKLVNLTGFDLDVCFFESMEGEKKVYSLFIFDCEGLPNIFDEKEISRLDRDVFRFFSFIDSFLEKHEMPLLIFGNCYYFKFLEYSFKVFPVKDSKRLLQFLAEFPSNIKLLRGILEAYS